MRREGGARLAQCPPEPGSVLSEGPLAPEMLPLPAAGGGPVPEAVAAPALEVVSLHWQGGRTEAK